MSEINKVKLTNNSEFDFKDDTGTLSDHLHNYEDLVPLMSKTFTNVIGSSNNFAGAWFFYGKVQPTDFYDIYQIHYRITSVAAGRSDSKTTCDVWICGTQSALLAYSSFNVIANTGYYAQHNNEFYRATSAGITNQYGHLIGVRLQSSWNPTTAANSRTITVDIIETKNCTFTFFDNMTKYADVPGTGATNYSAYSDLNATSQGLQETGDADNVDSIICYFNLKTGVQGIWQNSLCMEDGNGCYQNICTASNGTATGSNRTTDNTKLANANGFRVGSPIYYVATNYNANTNINGWGAIRTMQGNLFDARWSFNVTLTANSLTPFAPIYLVGTINSTDGLFYLDQTWWTQTPTATDKIYVLVGGCYDSTTTNCRISLLEHNLWYKYDGSKLVELTNGHIVAKDVPANAVFTDTTYESKQEAQGGTDLSLVTTGEKYTWNHNSGGTDEKVKQSPTTDNADYRVILSNSANNTEETSGVKKNSSLKYNPSTGNLQTTQLNGVAVGSSPKFTDANVTQTKTTSGTGYELLISGTATNATATEQARKCEHFQVDASSGILTVSRVHSGDGKQDSRVDIGNDKDSSTTTGSTRGYLRMYAADGKYTNLVPSEGQTTGRSLYLPVTDGNKTLATTDDIKNATLTIRQNGTSVGNFSSNASTASIVDLTDNQVRMFPVPSNADGYYWFALCDSQSDHVGQLVYKTPFQVNTTNSVLLVNDSDGYLQVGSTISGSLGKYGNLRVDLGPAYMRSTEAGQNLVIASSNEGTYRLKLGVWDGAWMFAPTNNGKVPLGGANYRWGQIYSTNASISTSDRKEKKDILPLDESAKDFIMALNPVSFKFIDGDSGRTHYGMIAQDVEEEMEELGMTPMDFAGFCKDQKTVPFQDGEDILKSMPIEGEYTYGLRYEEFIPAMIKTIQMQQQEIDELKRQLAEIKAMLNGGN